jgi:hypothetical protein
MFRQAIINHYEEHGAAKPQPNTKILKTGDTLNLTLAALSATPGKLVE